MPPLAETEDTAAGTQPDIEIEVQGYDKPFGFNIKPAAYQRYKRTAAKNPNAAGNNFLKECSTDWTALGPLLDERESQYDMTLADVLLGELAEEMGLGRTAVVKKRKT